MFRGIMPPSGLSKPSKKLARSRHQAKLDLHFDLEKGGDTFFQNGGLLLDYCMRP
jgi:hypothetical protein